MAQPGMIAIKCKIRKPATLTNNTSKQVQLIRTTKNSRMFAMIIPIVVAKQKQSKSM